jgi:hypothetical protein
MNNTNYEELVQQFEEKKARRIGAASCFHRITRFLGFENFGTALDIAAFFLKSPVATEQETLDALKMTSEELKDLQEKIEMCRRQ